MMPDREKVISEIVERIESSLAVNSEYVNVPLDLLQYALALLKEQEAMVKPTKCPCGELFDANDSSFCPKCGCAYGKLSGRYTNIGR